MIVHLNGQLVPLEQAKISPLDRGFVFGDGVYEGLRAAAVGGKTHIVGLGRHIERMRLSLEGCRIGFDPEVLGPASVALLEANGLADAFVYWQVTRGTPGPGDPPRSRAPKGSGMRPTVFGYCAPQPPLSAFAEPPRKSAVVLEDIRWTMGRIKSISLMGNILLAMQADAAGAEDAIFVRNGLLAEGMATNVVLALPRGGCGGKRGFELVTPSLESVPILSGVTRLILLEADRSIVERPVRADELRDAAEVMLIGTTTMVTSVVSLDGTKVGIGAPGPEARRLLRVLLDAIAAEAGAAAPRPASAAALR